MFAVNKCHKLQIIRFILLFFDIDICILVRPEMLLRGYEWNEDDSVWCTFGIQIA